MMLKVIRTSTANEASVAHVTFGLPFQISQFRKRVHDDTEDDVQTNGGDEDEEGEVEDDQEAKSHECVFRRVVHETLKYDERYDYVLNKRHQCWLGSFRSLLVEN